MGYRDRVVVVGQTVIIMALMDSSQFGIFLVTERGKFLVTSVKKTTVFLLLFSPELMLLRLGGDKL